MENYSLLKSLENVLFVEKHIHDIEQDVMHQQRPQLNTSQTFAEIYQQRMPKYLSVANYIFTIPARSDVFRDNRNIHLEHYFKTISKPWVKFAKKVEFNFRITP